ncbi:putative fatty acyl-CoA reductase CG5065 [Diabrotica virgifera virgifera]|uniref:Fatty acyl-CoA reductase n=1 Tax=Diabrotica virgifera virgifera TaxID=50390 RepID=A0A6P7GBR3_DIAVI|nr:putative fatty acyl-CoA reductase CG5065 [Diabrotica virgifera virgifera]XP_050501735.1 putative fatty acyl-CoA reductase CG5065 [Diabrotica virgifera virgifera]
MAEILSNQLPINVNQMTNLEYHYKMSTNSINDFYKSSNVLITGGTGFVGKALLEKLLRSCPGIQRIYLLMRSKKGRNVNERLDELLKNPVFGRLREENDDIFMKIRPILGDISLVNLGMCNQDLLELVENVDIVFHSAATVKFNEDLKQALIYNALGTKRILDFCCLLKQLKSFVYVSTAFSNPDKENISESVYEAPYNPEDIFTLIEDLSKDSFDMLSHKLLGNHPNTYTYTKAMAEQMVLMFSNRIPSAIVRPSIITAAWREPYPGWVDSVSGITGVFMECGRGTIKSVLCNEKYKMDIIPVDIVVNTLITSAWHTVYHRSSSLRVYNCTSGQINPITWRDFKNLTLKYSRESPSKYVTWYPGFTYRTSKSLHKLFATMYHIVPSAVLDAYLLSTRRKPMMLKISTKFYDALLAGSFFSTNEWNFQVSTMKSLTKVVNGATDGANFETNFKSENGFTWEEYVQCFHLGVRQYILKDKPTSLVEARKKLKRLYWFQKMLELLFFYTVLRICFPYIYNWTYKLFQ